MAETVLFPRVQRLARTYLLAELGARGKSQPVVSKQPGTIPNQWIRIVSQGGPRSIWEWEPMLNVFVYANDEVVAEGNSNLVHSLLLDAPGVEIEVPEYDGAYRWIRRARHVSGPHNLGDEDLPDLEMFRIVVIWHLLPIP